MGEGFRCKGCTRTFSGAGFIVGVAEVVVAGVLLNRTVLVPGVDRERPAVLLGLWVEGGGEVGCGCCACGLGAISSLLWETGFNAGRTEGIGTGRATGREGRTIWLPCWEGSAAGEEELRGRGTAPMEGYLMSRSCCRLASVCGCCWSGGEVGRCCLGEREDFCCVGSGGGGCCGRGGGGCFTAEPSGEPALRGLGLAKGARTGDEGARFFKSNGGSAPGVFHSGRGLAGDSEFAVVEGRDGGVLIVVVGGGTTGFEGEPAGAGVVGVAS